MSPRFLSAFLLSLCAGIAAVQAQTPRFAECTIHIGDAVIKPISAPTAYRQEHAAGDRVVWVSGATVGAVKAPSAEAIWSIGSPDSRHLQWMSADSDSAYLIGCAPRELGRRQAGRYDAPARVRVIDLATGKWRPDLMLGEAALESGRAEAVLGVLCGEGRVIILSATVVDAPTDYETDGDLVGYRVTCFEKEKGRTWSVPFKPSGLTEQRPTAFLLSSRRPTATDPDVRPLTAIGDNVLVCAGAQEAVICLDQATGAVKWKLERPWEFQRGFIGPSVWSHHIARFGDDMFEFGNEPDKLAAPRAEFDKRYTCSIVGGPIVVEVPTKVESSVAYTDYRVFLAVSKAERGAWPQYLSTCYVYEFSGDYEASPIAVAPLPTMVRGGQAAVNGGRVVWACQDDGFVCIAPSKSASGFIGGGPGGPDLVLRTAWYRQISDPAIDAWLETDRAGDPVAFGDGVAVRLSGGGHETTPEARAMRFPISIIDLATGMERTGAIVIPHDGSLTEPASNYRGGPGPSGAMRYHTYGARYYAVTWLEVVGDRLRVGAASEGSEEATFLDFKLADVIAASR